MHCEHLVVWEGAEIIHRFPVRAWQLPRFQTELLTLGASTRLQKENAELSENLSKAEKVLEELPKLKQLLKKLQEAQKTSITEGLD